MMDINLDVNVINVRQQFQKRRPVVALTDDETLLLRRYLELLHLNAKTVKCRFMLRASHVILSLRSYMK